MVAWVGESGPCGAGQPTGFGACARSVASLIRELTYDHAPDQLVSRPVADYALLHNATFLASERMVLPAGATRTLPVPAHAGGALDLEVSFDLSKLPSPRPKEVLPFMNDTDLPGGDYKETHLPQSLDQPQVCAKMCLADPKCMVWTLVVRGKPAGSGACIFKNESHGCPSPQ